MIPVLTRAQQRARAQELEEHKRALVAYLHVKLAEQDWHGVRDAAADIEVLCARISEMKRGAA